MGSGLYSGKNQNFGKKFLSVVQVFYITDLSFQAVNLRQQSVERDHTDTVL